MHNKVVLLDLEQNMPSAKLLRNMVEHYPTLYLFNCTGQFQYCLEDLTEFSSWVVSGQVIILEIPEATEKEFEYAVVTGQLMALLDADTHIDVISAMPCAELLLDIMRSSDLDCSLIQVESENQPQKHIIPSAQTIHEKPYLQMVKKYCDALGKMTGKPSTVETLKNSVANILQVVPEKAQHLVGMLINLKIVKRIDEQIAYRKKVLKEWTELQLDHTPLQEENTNSAAQPRMKLEKIDQILEKLRTDSQQVLSEIDQQDSVEAVQKVLFKNFDKIDPVQIEVIQKLNDLKTNKPKDIYELRDLLEQMFPKSDIRLLLKELIEKGYIYWNGHEVVYSHEMYLN
ncbi:hypothetical protein [Acinetobacter sp.]|uniref:hypothetical protein n=1 Tax=Acinetobacter sp. TaxID=472 RepID=UPI0025908A82|nr:hypothetical protein [Acinetobacter sp.]